MKLLEFTKSPMRLDDASEKRLMLVHPALAVRVRNMAAQLAEEHIAIMVTQGLRSWNEQSGLYAKGRTTPGPIVTNAPPGHSYHQFGLAVDLAPIMPDHTIDWNKDHPAWKRIVEVGKSVELVDGAEWRTFPDWPHFQFTGKFPVSPTDEVRSVFLQAGMAELWQESGLKLTS